MKHTFPLLILRETRMQKNYLPCVTQIFGRTLPVADLFYLRHSYTLNVWMKHKPTKIMHRRFARSTDGAGYIFCHSTFMLHLPLLQLDTAVHYTISNKRLRQLYKHKFDVSFGVRFYTKK